VSIDVEVASREHPQAEIRRGLLTPALEVFLEDFRIADAAERRDGKVEGFAAGVAVGLDQFEIGAQDGEEHLQKFGLAKNGIGQAVTPVRATMPAMPLETGISTSSDPLLNKRDGAAFTEQDERSFTEFSGALSLIVESWIRLRNR
jgi:hypothetical protein